MVPAIKLSTKSRWSLYNQRGMRNISDFIVQSTGMKVNWLSDVTFFIQ